MSVIRKKKHPLWALQGMLWPTVVMVLLIVFLSALSDMDTGQAHADTRQLEEALRRACVTCYATQGVYPPDLNDLVEHYGLQIDWSRYAIDYEVFAENIMPEITVMELER